MRILWAVNIVPANVSTLMGVQGEVLGGWVESMAERLKTLPDIEIAMACRSEQGLSFDETVDGIRYWSLVYGGKNEKESIKQRCKEIIKAFSPDLIQIEGTEFPHARAMLEAGKEAKIPVIVSMQGILNGQYDYQCGHLQMDDLMFSASLTNIMASWTLHLRKTRWYAPRMKPEKAVIEGADYILGRTTWDRAHVYAINPKAKYYACNRNLRPPFYETEWGIDRMERHTLYVGNGYYALKGLHFVVKAFSLLVTQYPDIKVYVAGYRPYEENDKRPFYKRGYGAYLKKLIRDLGVESHIVFTGALKAREVAEKLASVNAYVLCSVAENSPNTLGEAMLVGTPCVASYVGGVPDMAVDGKEALIYRDDDPELLAWQIKRVFDDDALACSLSENGKRRAMQTHDTQQNAEQLIRVYREILGDLPDKGSD